MLTPVKLKTIAWSASGSNSEQLDEKASTIAGLAAMVVAFVVRFKCVATDHAATADTGNSVISQLGKIALGDRFGKTTHDMNGVIARSLEQFLTGRRTFDDPSFPGTGSGALTRYAYALLPLFGGENGVRGFRRYDELNQPLERYVGGNFSVDFTADTLNATITSGEVELWALCRPTKRPVVGPDMIVTKQSTTDSQLKVAVGHHAHLGSFLYDATESNLTSYTGLEIKQGGLLQAVPTVEPLAFSWNVHAAPDSDTYLDPSAPRFVPVVYPGTGSKQSDLRTFADGSMIIDYTAKPATAQIAVINVEDGSQVRANMAGINGRYEGQGEVLTQGRWKAGEMGGKQLAHLARFGARRY